MPKDVPNAPVTTPPDVTAGAAPPADLAAAAPVPTAAPAGPPTPTGATVFPARPGAPVSDEHHRMIGRVFNTIFTNKTEDWAQTPQGPVKVQREMAPGEVARGILAAAVTGMAAGYAPAVRGRGPGAAASAGFEAAKEQREADAATKERQAQEQFKTAGEAQEREIRAAENARAQVRSVEESQ
ncbi:MAG: hypothetical protein KGL39_53530, partial [Patescibacteria group bacterium]|nr:hypothetical protein [Patescibacteria group bacterium]